ncbi:hypothetical protein AB0H42_30080 [Nocardia sp. NPDC050799]
MSSVARLIGISRTTLYKYVPEISDGPAADTAGSRSS